MRQSGVMVHWQFSSLPAFENTGRAEKSGEASPPDADALTETRITHIQGYFVSSAGWWPGGGGGTDFS